MKRNGFTLIELLGVIVLLALLMIIVFPSIINSVKNSSNKTDDLTLELIYNAADLYISNHANQFPEAKGNKYVISLKDLVDEGLLVSPIKLSNSDEDLTEIKSLQVIYEDGFQYELKDNDEVEEVIFTCTPVTGADLNYKYVYYDGSNFSMKTAVYNTGTKSDGDAYRCQVNAQRSYIFNIIGQDDAGNYNLLLNHNLGTVDGTTVTVDSIFNTLTNLTDGWTNIDKRTDSFTGSYLDGTNSTSPTTANYTFNYTNHYARFIEYEEIEKFAQSQPEKDFWIVSILNDSEVNNFKWQYTSSMISAYEPVDSGITFQGLSCGIFACSHTGTFGIRPVITVNESQIAS